MGLKKRVAELEESLAKALRRIEELESVVEENISLKKELDEVKKKLKEKSKPDFVKDPVENKPKKTGQKKGIRVTQDTFQKESMK